MLYPKEIEKKLGFNKIKETLKLKCSSNLGQCQVDLLRFSTKHEIISKLLRQTDEFIRIIQSKENLEIGEIIDVSNSIDKSRTEGSICEGIELLSIVKTSQAIFQCDDFFNNHDDKYPALSILGNNLNIDRNIIQKISQKIDDQGKVKDNASKELSIIRSQLKNKYNKVKTSLQYIYKNAIKEGFVPKGTSLTIRDGRMVIPILVEYKKRIKGLIHDESSTGSVIFIEPTTIFEGNNEIKELENSEKREITRILKELTSLVRNNANALKHGISYISKVDFIRAKARFAIQYDGIVTSLENSPKLKWYKTYHPLLKISSNDKSNIIPLDIELNEQNRILVISGSNAGGKSVALKTVGLTQYMLQCGLPILVDNKSKLGIFSDIFIDIGDEQSLENNLSTYSSHLNAMKTFIQNSKNSSLCLIDEFGTGTDPHFGGAIAQAILSELNKNKTYGVITTHYGNIKQFAQNTTGLINGGMKFDLKQLHPLFKLEIGKLGSSYSIEIAKRIGLPNTVVNYAKSIIGKDKFDMDQTLISLEQQKLELTKKEALINNKLICIQEQELKYNTLYEQLENKKNEILNDAKEKASSLLNETNKEIEKTIRHIKENNAQKTETKKIRKKLNSLKNKVVEEKKPKIIEKNEILIGDFVKILDQDVIGKVVGIKGNDLEIEIGLLKTFIKKNRLQKIPSINNFKRSNFEQKSIPLQNIITKHAEFNTTLNIRGKRVNEIIPELEKFLDESVLFGLNEVRVLHGKGAGILRDVVRKYSKEQPYIEKVADEHIERGGSGITVITLK